MIGGRTDPVGKAEEELHRLFPGERDLSGATAWAAETLRDAGVDATSAPLRSVRVLRRAERRLSAVTARYLVETVSDRPQGSRRRESGGPHLE
jgi:hypothetical protein